LFVVSLVVVPDAVALAVDFGCSRRKKPARFDDRPVMRIIVHVAHVAAQRILIQANVFAGRCKTRTLVVPTESDFQARR
jgi:hypothetical protein